MQNLFLFSLSHLFSHLPSLFCAFLSPQPPSHFHVKCDLVPLPFLSTLCPPLVVYLWCFCLFVCLFDHSDIYAVLRWFLTASSFLVGLIFLLLYMPCVCVPSYVYVHAVFVVHVMVSMGTEWGVCVRWQFLGATDYPPAWGSLFLVSDAELSVLA